MSLGGAKLRIDYHLAAPQSARLVMPPFGAFGGTIVWRADGVVGMEFAGKDHPRLAKLITSISTHTPR